MEIVTLVVLLPLMVGLLVQNVQTSARLRELNTRTRRAEAQLTAVLTRLEIEDPWHNMPEVAQALRNGNTLAAVKAYQNATGVDLASAKRAVDALAAGSGR